MKIVIFGLSISSSWGNGHATLWRGLCRALGKRGHAVVFYEQDAPYYASTRDGVHFPGCELRLYSSWAGVRDEARLQLTDADVAMVTSYCPDGEAASQLVLDSHAVRCFYDLDTPVTLNRLKEGQRANYLPPQGLGDFDLVLSYTGGEALRQLKTMLGARRVEPLYGSVDPEVHKPSRPDLDFSADMSYLGTYSDDRQEALEQLLIEPARRRPMQRFSLGGAQYPADFPWTRNIFFVRHLPAVQHSAFYCSSRMTLNVTRRPMADMGYCPSGRLFEAAACGVPVLSDWWKGLGEFFQEGSEILVCRSTEDSLAALDMTDEELDRVARAARDRTMSQHTAAHRVLELEAVLQEAACTRQA